MCDRCAIGAQCMATVELKRFVMLVVGTGAVASIKNLARERLNGCGRQYLREFRQVCTSLYPGQPLPDPVPKALHQVETDQLLVGWTDRIAITWIWNSVGDSMGIDDVELQINGQAQPEIVHGFACGPDA